MQTAVIEILKHVCPHFRCERDLGTIRHVDICHICLPYLIRTSKFKPSKHVVLDSNICIQPHSNFTLLSWPWLRLLALWVYQVDLSQRISVRKYCQESCISQQSSNGRYFADQKETSPHVRGTASPSQRSDLFINSFLYVAPEKHEWLCSHVVKYWHAPSHPPSCICTSSLVTRSYGGGE